MTSTRAPSVPGAASPQPPAPGGPVAPRSVLTWTGALVVLVTVTSVAGLLDPRVYQEETANWALQAQGQDVGNLLAVVVLALAARRWAAGSAPAGLVWLGTLLYLVYAFVIYAMAVHLNYLFLVYVAVLGLSAWGVLVHVPVLRRSVVLHPGEGARTWPAVALVAIGVLFAGLWLAELVPATVSGQVPATLTGAGLVVNPVHVIDLSVVLPAFVLSGVSVLRGREAGLFWVGTWLAFSVLMGSSIVAAMVLTTAAGQSGAVVPAVMVSVVVVVSLVAAWAHLRGAALREPGG
ncbi:hypothetical protein [Ornithinimicrobium pekingense]|uniref:hypothetical protein n=1 Tax=Ornithinimicrobium pekingense TaxID=384677 RepID=UPI0003B2E73C|nr:hypothetical protein [Ornithinimicrobium pekingense]